MGPLSFTDLDAFVNCSGWNNVELKSVVAITFGSKCQTAGSLLKRPLIKVRQGVLALGSTLIGSAKEMT